MAVYQRGQSWYYDFQSDGVRYRRRVGPTKTDARRAEDQARTAARDRRYQREWGIKPARGTAVPTVRVFWEREYLPEARNNLAPSGLPGIVYVLKRFMALAGHYRLDDIPPTVFEDYKTSRLKTVSVNMVRFDFKKLKRFFGLAIERGYLRDNPARIRLPRQTARDYRVLEPEQERAFFDAIVDPTARAMIRFMFLLGLRRGEIVGLRWSQVDTRKRQLSVLQSKTRFHKELPLVPEAIEILRAVRPAAPLHEGYVFLSRRGGPFAPNTLWWHFDRARRQAGLRGLRPHDLRHTIAAWLVQRGEALSTVGRILGHKPPYHQTLLYAQHVKDSELRRAAERLQDRHEAPQNPPQAETGIQH